MLTGIPNRRVDPDHGRGGLDEARRSSGATPTVFPAPGEPFANGIGGARSDGHGFVLRDADVVAGALTRAQQAIAAATPGVPAFDARGNLPAGVHAAASWYDFTRRFVSSDRRIELAVQLRSVLDALCGAGISQAIVGGSYVTTKPEPGDVDLAFVARDAAGIADAKRALADLGGDLGDVHVYPAGELLTEAPILEGVRPGSNVLEFFQRSREGDERGVVVVPTSP